MCVHAPRPSACVLPKKKNRELSSGSDRSCKTLNNKYDKTCWDSFWLHREWTFILEALLWKHQLCLFKDMMVSRLCNFPISDKCSFLLLPEKKNLMNEHPLIISLFSIQRAALSCTASIKLWHTVMRHTHTEKTPSTTSDREAALREQKPQSDWRPKLDPLSESPAAPEGFHNPDITVGLECTLTRCRHTETHSSIIKHLLTRQGPGEDSVI